MDDLSLHEVSQWIQDVKAGCPKKMDEICKFYLQALTRAADHKIRQKGVKRQILEGDDFANSVLSSVAVAVRENRLPDWVQDRNSLWGLLASKLHNKVVDALRREHSSKRGGGMEPIRASHNDESDLLGQIPDRFAATIDHALIEIRDELQDAELHDVLNLALEGHDKDEIAKRIRRSPRTVERKLLVIRKLLEAKADDAD